jgi:hypothetical protein
MLVELSGLDLTWAFVNAGVPCVSSRSTQMLFVVFLRRN